MSPADAILLAAEMTIVNGEIVFTDGKNIVTSASDDYLQNISLNYHLYQNELIHFINLPLYNFRFLLQVQLRYVYMICTVKD